MLGKDYERQDCTIARTLETIGERWTLLIVRDAFFGVRRFSDFQAHLDIPKAVLSDRLSGLVEDGIMERNADPERPGRAVYELTKSGRDLWPVLHSLLIWGGHYRAPNSRVFMHAACGTKLAESGACPACDATPEVDQIVTAPKRGHKPLRDDPVSVALNAGPHRLLEPLDT
jgi:DNA-binding HxlR family transcriptional regulator